MQEARAERLECAVLLRPFRRSSRMGQMHDGDDVDSRRGEVRQQRRCVDGQRAGVHRVADRMRGDSPVAVEPDRDEVVTVAKRGVDPLVAEHRDPCAVR